MKIKFNIGITSASAIDARLNSVTEVVNWIEENNMDYFLPHFLTLKTTSGYSYHVIDLHEIPYSATDTVYNIILKGIALIPQEILKGIEIQF